MEHEFQGERCSACCHHSVPSLWLRARHTVGALQALPLHEFLMTAVRNYCKLLGFKQHVLLCSSGGESLTQISLAKIKALTEWPSLFWSHGGACGILVPAAPTPRHPLTPTPHPHRPLPRMEPVASLQWKHRVLNTEPLGKPCLFDVLERIHSLTFSSF